MKRVSTGCNRAEGLPLNLNTGKAQRLARDFAHDQDGGIGWLSLSFFMLMVLMGGMAVDLMRFEYARTSLQQTADRSALAAAARSNKLEAQDVVADYFAKDNKSAYLTDVDVDAGLNFKTVTVDAKQVQPTFFMRLMGTDSFDVPAESTAEERITNVEIAMALDVSGSMDGSGGNPTKFTNLKTAAKQFITDVLAKDTDNRISISIVPYNGQVNLGDTLYAKFTGIYDKPGIANVYCADLPSTSYSSTSLATSTNMPATGWVDTFTGTGGGGASYSTPTSTTYYGPTSSYASSYVTPNNDNKWCPNITNNYVQLPTNDQTALKNKIDGMDAVGATSINAGIKWGLTMLDPGSRSLFNGLTGSGTNSIPSYFSGRPFDYTDHETMKVIVLMTDGENFAEERLNDGYRTGTSPIFFDLNSKNYSIYHPGYTGSTTNKYYYPSNNSWNAYQQGATTSGSTVVPGTSVQLTWQEVWYGFSKSVKVGSTTYSYTSSGVRASWVAWQLYARAFGTSSSTRTSYYNTYINAIRTRTDTTVMDSQLQQICTLAKNNGVIIYGIAFEAPSNGETQIAKCAAQASEQGDPTASAYYFESDGSKIGTDFKTIASNISQLRLTQ